MSRRRFAIIVILLLLVLAAVNRGNSQSSTVAPTPTIRTYDTLEDCYNDPQAVACQPIEGR